MYTSSTGSDTPPPFPTALDVYIKDKVAENAVRVGDHIKKRLEVEFLPLPCVGNIDGLVCFEPAS